LDAVSTRHVERPALADQKYAVPSVIGYIKRKSAIHIARTFD
jgi:hypothetical protein